MDSLRDKVVVITGASSGFGRGAALEFARQGADLVLAARRTRLLKQLAKECRRQGVRAVAVKADVSRPEDVDKLAGQALREFGRFDVWVNNAGVATYGEFDQVPLEEHEQVVRTNLLGAIYGAHAALQHFRDRGRGVLINMSSYLGKGSAPYHSSYVASKHGVRGLGMALRQDLQTREISDIHVCTVMPTSHDTPFFAHAGNHTGKPVRPTRPVYDPQQVIDTVVELALNPRDEVMVGTSAKVGSVAGKLIPAVLERRMSKKVRKEHMDQRETASATSGALFEAMRDGGDIRDGWLEEQGGHKLLATMAAIAVPLTLGALALARRAEREKDLPGAA
jgi:short-subunit dehydrogenase